MSQEKYVERILERFNMKHAKPIGTPFGGHFKLSKKSCLSSTKEKENITSIPYSSTIGSLMYDMVCTLLDIAHVVGVVSRFMVNLGKNHWEVVKWIFRYLSGSSKQWRLQEFCPGCSYSTLKKFRVISVYFRCYSKYGPKFKIWPA